MTVFEKIVELQKHLNKLQKQGLNIGFVPTMGALHRGHISLIEKSLKETDITIVSIFVNPTQFNNPDDLKKYPRTPEKDLKMLEDGGVNLVFMPAEEEMYPTLPSKKEAFFDLEGEGGVMEGKFRPGHFQGVVEVVSRLFDIVKPDKAFFGEKDFQQLFVIRKWVKEKSYPVEIIACPTVREENGLAMSSRNMLLSEEDRKEAGKISQALFFIRDSRNSLTPEEAKAKAWQMIEANGKMKIQYLEIASEDALKSVSDWNSKLKLRAFVAVQFGNIRLIDNVAL